MVENLLFEVSKLLLVGEFKISNFYFDCFSQLRTVFIQIIDMAHLKCLKLIKDVKMYAWLVQGWWWISTVIFSKWIWVGWRILLNSKKRIVLADLIEIWVFLPRLLSSVADWLKAVNERLLLWSCKKLSRILL